MAHSACCVTEFVSWYHCRTLARPAAIGRRAELFQWGLLSKQHWCYPLSVCKPQVYFLANRGITFLFANSKIQLLSGTAPLSSMATWTSIAPPSLPCPIEGTFCSYPQSTPLPPWTHPSCRYPTSELPTALLSSSSNNDLGEHWTTLPLVHTHFLCMWAQILAVWVRQWLYWGQGGACFSRGEVFLGGGV